MATITSRSGQQYTVPDAVESDYLAQGFTRPGVAVPGSGSITFDYASMKVGALRDAIAARNEGRTEADLIPLVGKKAALVAALEADDAAQAEGVQPGE